MNNLTQNAPVTDAQRESITHIVNNWSGADFEAIVRGKIIIKYFINYNFYKKMIVMNMLEILQLCLRPMKLKE